MPPKKASTKQKAPIKVKAIPKVKATPKKKVGTSTSLTIHPDPPALKQGAELTGILGNLPLEILVDVIILLKPREFGIFLSTCHAMTDFVSQNETSIYSRKYNSGQERNGLNHTLYSPVWKKAIKGVTVPIHPLDKRLGIDCVFDWKVQYLQDAKWNLITSNHKKQCMGCLKMEHTSLLEIMVEWKLKLCKLCLLTSLVRAHNVSIYSVSSGDLGTLNMLELETDTSKGVEKVNFYSAFDLKAICIQKNGSFINPVLPQTAATKETAMNYRKALVSTACLLQGGVDRNREFSDLMLPLPTSNSIDQGHFVEEFNHFISNRAFRKPNKGTAVRENDHPMGFARFWELVKRPIEEILNDYKNLVQNHATAFPDRAGRPFFLPATRESSVVPSEISIDAFQRIEEIAKEKGFSLDTHIEDCCTSQENLRIIQEYVLEPTQEKLIIIQGIFTDLFFEKRSRVVKSAVILPDITFIEDLQQSCIEKLGKREAKGREENLIRIYQISLILYNQKAYGKTAPSSLNRSNRPLTKVNVLELLREDVDFTDFQGHWGLAHYTTGKNIGLVTTTYRSTIDHRVARLKAVAGEVTGNDDKLSSFVITSFSPFLARFGDTFGKAINVRARNLRDRSRITMDEIEEEHRGIIKLMTTGLVSESSMVATIWRIGDCKCEPLGSTDFCPSGIKISLADDLRSTRCFITDIFIDEIVEYEQSLLMDFDWYR